MPDCASVTSSPTPSGQPVHSCLNTVVQIRKGSLQVDPDFDLVNRTKLQNIFRVTNPDLLESKTFSEFVSVKTCKDQSISKIAIKIANMLKIIS